MTKERKPLPSGPHAAQGARLALGNARRHLQVAKILKEERLFGPAYSHVILALEEMAKSWTLTLLVMGIDLPKKMLADVLSRHDVRHSLTFGFLYGALIQGLRVRAAVRVQQRHRVKDFPPELRDEFVKELQIEFKLLASHSRKRNPLIILLELTGSANEFKNQGLYVDFDGKKWTHPGRIAEKRFDLAYEVAKALTRGLGKTIVEVQKTNFQIDDSLRQLIKDQMVESHQAEPEGALTSLTKVALSI